MYIYIYIYIYIHIYIYTNKYIHVSKSLYIREALVEMCIETRGKKEIYIYIYLYKFMYIYILHFEKNCQVLVTQLKSGRKNVRKRKRHIKS